MYNTVTERLCELQHTSPSRAQQISHVLLRDQSTLQTVCGTPQVLHVKVSWGWCRCDLFEYRNALRSEPDVQVEAPRPATRNMFEAVNRYAGSNVFVKRM